MKETIFKDRVPLYPGRITLTPVEGKTNTYTMERADEPTEDGTPLDKATFNSIIHSRLTGRYYVPTVEKIVVSSYTGVTANPIPTTWNRVSSAEATSGAWKISSAINDDSEVYRAVDGSQSTRWVSAAGTAHELIIDTGSVLTVKKMLIETEAINGTYTSITIDGSNNGLDWTTLETLTTIPTTATEVTLTTTGAFKLYRLSFQTSYTNVNASVWEWAFSEYDFSTYSNNYTISEGVPTAWTDGQRILVEIPSTENTLAVVACTLNGIVVNTILQPSKRYELRYNGTSFDAKEV